MAHFAILCPEAGGHLFPTGSLGHELRRRGHQVTLVARSTAAPIAKRLELPLHELPEDDAPDYRIENDRICAMFDGNPSIEQLSKDDQTKLQILCKPRFPATFLPPNLVGYPLAIAEGEAVRKLECRD